MLIFSRQSRTAMSSKVTVVKAPAPDKKTVCVIGAGASGLTVLKEHLSMGNAVKCFDDNVRIGGVYTKSYDQTKLTTSSVLTAFSDFSTGLEDKPEFYSDEAYLDYLDGFAHKFGLYENINFRSKVLKVTRCLVSKKWLVTVKTNAYIWPHRSTFRLGLKHSDRLREQTASKLGEDVLKDFYDKAAKTSFKEMKEKFIYKYVDHVTGEHRQMAPADWNKGDTTTYAYDCLCVCTGTNTWASLPKFPGQEKFKGTLVHSEDYKKPDIFKGKQVLIIGAGESGSDICNEISYHAKKVAIVVRKKHGHLIPRKQSDGRVTDLNTNRCRYSNPYILGDWVGWANQHAKKFVAKYGGKGNDVEERQVLQKIGELNLEQQTSAFSKFGCKNEGFVEAMVVRGTELHRDGFRLEENKAVFDNGEEFKVDAIVACTGYRNSFPFFDHDELATDCGVKMKDLAEECRNPRKLYKQCIHPLFPKGELAFMGFARPAFGSIPPCSEMQSRLHAMTLSGHLQLGSVKSLRAQAKKDQVNYEWRFGYDAARVKGLVDFQLYTDDIAEVIGALPPLMYLFFFKPLIWWKIMFSSFTMHQYRFQGPFANPAVAEPVYEKQPVGDFLECSITAAFLVTAKVLSLFGFADFKPNNF